jgi:hypothetical protein
VLKQVGRYSPDGAFDGSGFDVAFSTIVDTVVICGTDAATDLKLDSSILYNSTAEAPPATLQGATNCTSIMHTVSFPQNSSLGATNVTGILPLLVDPAADNFRLKAGSPAIDRGNPASQLPIDLEGTARPQGSGRDSGAFEYK